MPDRYPLGLNINMGALRDWNRLVEVCQMLNSSHQMAMIGASSNPRNDIDGVMRLHSAIANPNLQWMIRIFSSKEGNWREFNAAAYVDYCTEIHRHFPNTIFDAPSNEPGVKDSEIDAFIDNQIDLIRRFSSRGIRYAACCYGVGSPHYEHVIGGKYDRLLHALAEHNNAYLSEHHYTMGWLEAGSGYGYDILLDPATLANKWRTKWAVQGGHYLIRRSDYWAMRADTMGIRRPRVYLTECPFDQIPDTVSQLNNKFNGAWDRIRNTYGMAQYNKDLRGVNSYEAYYDAVFPDLTYDEALAKVHVHFVDDCLYVDYMQAAFLFAWNTNWDIPQGSDHSIESRLPFFRLMANHAKTYVKSPDTTPLPVPTPVPTPIPPVTVPKRIRALVDALRIRATPMLTGSVLGYMPRDYTDVRYAVLTVDNATDNYAWRYIEIILPDSDNLVVGYVADSLIEVEPDAIELTAIEQDLILAYRAGNTPAILAILDNPLLVTITESESALLAAYRQRNVRALLLGVADILP